MPELGESSNLSVNSVVAPAKGEHWNLLFKNYSPTDELDSCNTIHPQKLPDYVPEPNSSYKQFSHRNAAPVEPVEAAPKVRNYKRHPYTHIPSKLLTILSKGKQAKALKKTQFTALSAAFGSLAGFPNDVINTLGDTCIFLAESKLSDRGCAVISDFMARKVGFLKMVELPVPFTSLASRDFRKELADDIAGNITSIVYNSTQPYKQMDVADAGNDLLMCGDFTEDEAALFHTFPLSEKLIVLGEDEAVAEALAFGEGVDNGMSIYSESLSGCARDDAWVFALADTYALIMDRYGYEWGVDFNPHMPEVDSDGEILSRELVMLSKFMRPDFWLTRITSAYNQNVEDARRISGQVGYGDNSYASGFAVKWLEQREREALAWMKKGFLHNDVTGGVLSVYDAYQSSVANPVNRRNELMARVKAMCEIKAAEGKEPLWVTMTAPSRFHAYTGVNTFKTVTDANGNVTKVRKLVTKENKHYDGSTVRASHAWLCDRWNLIRTSWDSQNKKTELLNICDGLGEGDDGYRELIDCCGLRVVEPHKDGTAHWHMLLFVDPADIEFVSQKFELYAYCGEKRYLTGNKDHKASDRTELRSKAARHARLKIDRLSNALGVVAYIAKYISKNIDGIALTESQIEKSELKAAKGGDNSVTHNNVSRVRAWASAHRVRQFQFFGDINISVWRALRKLNAGNYLGTEAHDYLRFTGTPDYFDVSGNKVLGDNADLVGYKRFCVANGEPELMFGDAEDANGFSKKECIGVSFPCGQIIKLSSEWSLSSFSGSVAEQVNECYVDEQVRIGRALDAVRSRSDSKPTGWNIVHYGSLKRTKRGCGRGARTVRAFDVELLTFKSGAQRNPWTSENNCRNDSAESGSIPLVAGVHARNCLSKKSMQGSKKGTLKMTSKRRRTREEIIAEWSASCDLTTSIEKALERKKEREFADLLKQILVADDAPRRAASVIASMDAAKERASKEKAVNSEK